MKNRDKLIPALVTFVLGIMFITLKGQVISIAMTLLGAALLVMAVVDFTRQEILTCAVKGIAGVIVIVFGWVLVDIALYILAAVLFIYGLTQLREKLKNKSVPTSTLGKVLHYLEPVASIVAAICLIFNKNGTVTWVFIVIGIALIADGLLALINLLGNKESKNESEK